MAKGLITVGTRFGRMQCTDIVQKDYYIGESDNGVAVKYPDHAHYIFKCDCGTTVERAEITWKGKRAEKDCGCGLAFQDGMGRGVSCYMPMALITALYVYAKAKGININQAIILFVRKGLVEENTNVAANVESSAQKNVSKNGG